MLTEVTTMENLRTMRSVGKVSITGLMVNTMMGHGRETRCMEWEYSPGKTGNIMKGSSLLTREKVKVPLHGLMEDNISEIGRMGSKTARVPISLRKEIVAKESGRVERRSGGLNDSQNPTHFSMYILVNYQLSVIPYNTHSLTSICIKENLLFKCYHFLYSSYKHHCYAHH